ncbi:hypothetical protein [Thermomonas sp.]|uniref:hypothetical protein n=1 Tax=Thermomonas sp. TaxID=1971895 RepID=UPI00262866DC|nr:hypothetical protein [Thermomonas sp.]
MHLPLLRDPVFLLWARHPRRIGVGTLIHRARRIRTTDLGQVRRGRALVFLTARSVHAIDDRWIALKTVLALDFHVATLLHPILTLGFHVATLLHPVLALGFHVPTLLHLLLALGFHVATLLHPVLALGFHVPTLLHLLLALGFHVATLRFNAILALEHRTLRLALRIARGRRLTDADAAIFGPDTCIAGVRIRTRIGTVRIVLARTTLAEVVVILLRVRRGHGAECEQRAEQGGRQYPSGGYAGHLLSPRTQTIRALRMQLTIARMNQC